MPVAQLILILDAPRRADERKAEMIARVNAKRAAKGWGPIKQKG